MNLFDPYMDAIHGLCKKFHVSRLYVFGSVLTESFTEKSDVDMVVDFEPMDYRRYSKNYFGLKFALEDLLQRPIDLLEEKALKNPVFKQQLLRQRQQIYGYTGTKLAV